MDATHESTPQPAQLDALLQRFEEFESVMPLRRAKKMSRALSAKGGDSTVRAGLSVLTKSGRELLEEMRADATMVGVLEELAQRIEDRVELLRSAADALEEADTRLCHALSVLPIEGAASLTFEQCARKYISSHKVGWRNASHTQDWEDSLKQHVFPVMGPLLVRDVAVRHVLAVVEPIWVTTNETASRARLQIDLVLDWAIARGLRKGPNPARFNRHLDQILEGSCLRQEGIT